LEKAHQEANRLIIHQENTVSWEQIWIK
jgi:hypothetical protein